MRKKNKLFVLGSGLVTAMLTFALVGCGGGETSQGENSSTPPVTLDSDGNIVETGIFETTTIDNDVVLDDNGEPVFDEEVSIKMWSVIGDPDQVVFQGLIDQFNDEYLGMIHIDLVYQGHFDYYTALDTTWTNDFESFPDVCFMHNEKTVQYAYKGYLYPLDTLFEKSGISLDLTQAYENIDRVTQYRDHRFAVPVDAHGFVTSFRQDIIKKNGLGFDNNTRFIPESRSEYEELLTGLRTKADAGQLYIRNINRGQNHAWKLADKNTFYPSFTQSTDPDGLSSLYANNGSLVNDAQDTITFQNNTGFQTYLTDQVDRWNDRLIGESGTAAESFGVGNVVLFSEGPWWVSQTYSASWNNSELRSEGNGVTAEDAADPVYSAPYTASRPTGWWTTDENVNTDNGAKWYGNGHAVSITRHCTSMQKVAAAMTFIKWYTQGFNETTSMHNLTKWCTSGHVPAWKNVYESDDYQDMLTTNMTCRALGDPSNVIAMEGLEFESTISAGLADACTGVINALKSSGGCTKEQALQILIGTAESTQFMLDTLREEN